MNSEWKRRIWRIRNIRRRRIMISGRWKRRKWRRPGRSKRMMAAASDGRSG